MVRAWRTVLAMAVLVGAVAAPSPVAAADPSPRGTVHPDALGTTAFQDHDSEFAVDSGKGLYAVSWVSWTETIGMYAIDEARPTMDHLTSYGSPWWDIRLEGPDETRLTAGTYTDARDEAHAGAGKALFAAVTSSGMCEDARTDFTIREIDRDGTGLITLLDLSFDLACPGAERHARGEVRFAYSLNPVSILINSPMWLGVDNWQAPYGEVPVGDSGVPLQFTFTAAGRAGSVVGTPVIEGADPDDFAIAATTCDGTTLAWNETCTVGIAFTPTAGGLREAELVVPSDADTGARRIALNAIGKIPTTTTIELAHNPAYGSGEVSATVTVTPNPGGGQAGVKWFRNSSWDYRYAPLDANGTAVVTGYGSGTVYGYFPGSGDYLTSISDGVDQVIGRASQVNLAAGVNPQEATKDVTLTATLSLVPGDGMAPTTGTLQLVDETTATVLATRDVADGLTVSWSGPLAIGDHEIRATYDGQVTPFLVGPSSASVVQHVVADSKVDVSGAGVQYTRFYPVVDGYRDTVAARGTLGEAAQSVSFKVVSVTTGKTVRTASLGARPAGAYSWAWNGRSTGGTLQAAGQYRIVQTIKDSVGNPLVVTSTVTLSKRTVVWHTDTQTAYATTLWGKGSDGGVFSRAKSNYAHGLYMHSNGGWAGAVYRWSISTGLAVKSVTFKVTGKSRSTAKSWMALWNPTLGAPGYMQAYDTWTRAGTAYGTYKARAAGSTHQKDSYVYGLFYVETAGGRNEVFDIAKVAVTYTYAEWR